MILLLLLEQENCDLQLPMFGESENKVQVKIVLEPSKLAKMTSLTPRDSLDSLRWRSRVDFRRDLSGDLPQCALISHQERVDGTFHGRNNRAQGCPAIRGCGLARAPLRRPGASPTSPPPSLLQNLGRRRLDILAHHLGDAAQQNGGRNFSNF